MSDDKAQRHASWQRQLWRVANGDADCRVNGPGEEGDGPARGQAPQTRRVDGQPETDADRRFFDLRESGYTGPIDQDGEMVTDPQTLASMAGLHAGPGRAALAERTVERWLAEAAAAVDDADGA